MATPSLFPYLMKGTEVTVATGTVILPPSGVKLTTTPVSVSASQTGYKVSTPNPVKVTLKGNKNG